MFLYFYETPMMIRIILSTSGWYATMIIAVMQSRKCVLTERMLHVTIFDKNNNR